MRSRAITQSLAAPLVQAFMISTSQHPEPLRSYWARSVTVAVKLPSAVVFQEAGQLPAST